jgi:hypothetical protein
MAEALILETPMLHWMPTTYLVALEEPLKQFSPEDGSLIAEHDYIAVSCKVSNPQEAYVFPSDENGGIVDPTLTPIRRRPYAPVETILTDLGYTL